MLDPMAMVLARMRVEGRVVGIEYPVDGPVALGVDADLPAGRMSATDRVAKRVLRRPAASPRTSGVRAVGS